MTDYLIITAFYLSTLAMAYVCGLKSKPRKPGVRRINQVIDPGYDPRHRNGWPEYKETRSRV